MAQAHAGRDEAQAQYRRVVLGALQHHECSLSRFARQRRYVAERSAAMTRLRDKRGDYSRRKLEAER